MKGLKWPRQPDASHRSKWSSCESKDQYGGCWAKRVRFQQRLQEVRPSTLKLAMPLLLMTEESKMRRCRDQCFAETIAQIGNERQTCQKQYGLAHIMAVQILPASGWCSRGSGGSLQPWKGRSLMTGLRFTCCASAHSNWFLNLKPISGIVDWLCGGWMDKVTRHSYLVSARGFLRGPKLGNHQKVWSKSEARGVPVTRHKSISVSNYSSK